MFVFIASIGAALILQRRIQQEYDGSLGFFERRKIKALVQRRFDSENENLDLELSKLLTKHRALLRGDDVDDLKSISSAEYDAALEELEREMNEDQLLKAFESLEKEYGEKKKKSI